MNFITTALLALLTVARASDEVGSEEKHDGMPVGALLPGSPVPGRFDSRHDSYHHHWDRRWVTTVSATITFLEQTLTSVTTMIPLVYTDVSILTTVATVSGCPKTTVVVISGTTTTTTSTTSTSSFITTSTASSITGTTTTVTTTSYTYTRPCRPTHPPCGCNRPRSRQHSMVRREVAPVYSDGDDEGSDEDGFKKF